MTDLRLSTSHIARKCKIQAKDLFDYLVNNLYLYKDGKDYKLTKKGCELGGSYRKTENYINVVWEADCLNEIINEFAPYLKGSKYRYPDEILKIINNLKKDEGENIHQSLEGGNAILKTEEQLNQYLFSHGGKHCAKLAKAFIKLSNLITNANEIQITDYGCGQGIASIVFLNFLENKQFPIKNIKQITLIDPGELALNRADELLKNSTHIVKINKDLDALSTQDLISDKDAVKFHLFSNILDMGGKFFDIKELANKITNSQSGDNYFVCVSPQNEEKLHEFTESITSVKIKTLIDDLFETDTSEMVEFSPKTKLSTIQFISHDTQDIENPSTFLDAKPWKNIHMVFKKEFVK